MRDGTPNGYATIEFNGNDYKIRWHVARGSESERMRIEVPEPNSRITSRGVSRIFRFGNGKIRFLWTTGNHHNILRK